MMPTPRRFGDEKTKKNRSSLFFRRGKVKNKILTNNDASASRGYGTNKGKKYVVLIPEFPLGKISPNPLLPASKTIFDANSDMKPGIITSPVLVSQKHESRTPSTPHFGLETEPGMDTLALKSPRVLHSQLNDICPNNSSEARTTNNKPEERKALDASKDIFDRTGNPAMQNIDSKKLDDSRDRSGSAQRLVSMFLPPPPTTRPPAREESPEANKGTEKSTDVIGKVEPKQRGNTFESEIAQQHIFEFQQQQRQKQQHQRQQAESQSNLQKPSTLSTSNSPILRARVAPNKAPRLSLSLSSFGLLGQSTLGDFLSPVSNPVSTSDPTAVHIAGGSNCDPTTDEAVLLSQPVESVQPHTALLRPLEDLKAAHTNRQEIYGSELTSAIQNSSRVSNEEEGVPVGGTVDSIDKSARNVKKVTFMDVTHLVEVNEVTDQSIPRSLAEQSANTSMMDDDIGTKLSLPETGDLEPSPIESSGQLVEQVARENTETMPRSRSSSTLVDVADINRVLGGELAAQANDLRSQPNGLLDEKGSLEPLEAKSATSEFRISASTYGIVRPSRSTSASTYPIHRVFVPKSRARKRVRHVQVQTRTSLTTQAETTDNLEPPTQALPGLSARSTEREETTNQSPDLESVLEINRVLRLEIAATRAQLAAETRAKQRVMRTMEQIKDKFDALSARAYEKLKEVLSERDAFEEAVEQLRESLQVHEKRETVM